MNIYDEQKILQFENCEARAVVKCKKSFVQANLINLSLSASTNKRLQLARTT